MPSDNAIFRAFGKKIPDNEGIIDEAFNSLPTEQRSAQYIKDHFSSLVSQIEDNAHRIYRTHETSIGSEVLRDFFTVDGTQIPRPEALGNIIQASFGDLNGFFLSLSQSRRTRAGKAFEIIIRKLFKSLSYPFDEQIIINGKPDFLLPGEAHYRRHATDCIIFTAKRTLRERWRQIVTEGTRGHGFFLATIDEDVSSNGLAEMNDNRIYLVTPDHIKSSIEHYRSAPNVISFEAFFRQQLDPAMQRWRENGVI